jgi:hypothetical protein
MGLFIKNCAYGPKIITNGLVLALDAGNIKSYPGSGTTWTDLSGNGNNGTLTNGLTYSSSNGGSIVFDGVNDFVQIAGSIVTSQATFIVWIKRNEDQNFFSGIIFSRGTSVSGMNFYSTSNRIGYTWNDNINTYDWDSGLIVPNLTWCMCAISVSGSSATGYLCQSSGITSSTNNVSHTSTTLNDIKIGYDDAGAELRYIKGDVAQVSVYNRALTAAEISQNFNATRSRFGL